MLWYAKGGQVDCMEVVLCLSQKVAKNGQILSMYVPKSGFFHFCCSPTKVGFLSQRTG